MTARNGSGGVSNLPDEEIRDLVERLNSLHDGDLALPLLVACGERAVPPLRQVLFQGRAASLFIPRQRVVWALAEIGAKDVLLEYLAAERRISDPMVRQGEDAVENTAARALAAWQTEDVFLVLSQKLTRRLMPGVIETLGRFRRLEPLPQYIRALEDDFCRRPAEQAIRELGEEARTALIDTARTPDPSGNCETPSSLCRRRAALRLLSNLKLNGGDWRRLASLVRDRDPEIAARSCWVALMAGGALDKGRAVRRLVDVLPGSDWLLQSEIESWLTEHFAMARDEIAEEIARRRSATPEKQAADNVLRLLLAVTREGAGKARACDNNLARNREE